MMSHIIICDKCGKVIKDDKDKTDLVIKTAEAYERGITGQTTYDLCPECRLKLNGWLFR